MAAAVFSVLTAPPPLWSVNLHRSTCAYCKDISVNDMGLLGGIPVSPINMKKHARRPLEWLPTRNFPTGIIKGLEKITLETE